MSAAPLVNNFDAAYFVARIGELEARKRVEKMRGLPINTVSPKLTAARKRLRELLRPTSICPRRSGAPRNGCSATQSNTLKSRDTLSMERHGEH